MRVKINWYKLKYIRGATALSVYLTHLLGTANDHPPGKETVALGQKPNIY